MPEPIVDTPDYEALAQALADAGAVVSAAEAHGIVSGALCAPGPADWRALILDPGDVALTPLLQALHSTTAANLAREDFEFAPLLPGEASLPAQVAALGDWCRGFVLGLAAGGINRISSLPGEVGEFVTDVMKIGDVEFGDDEESQQERSLAEIVEYLRAGVQLMFDEVHPPTKPAPPV